MAILLGAVTLSGSATISKVSTVLTEAGISGRAIDQAAISAETASLTTTAGVDAHLTIVSSAAPSASGTLTTNAEIVRYVYGASAIQGAATVSGGSPSLTLAGKTYGHNGLSSELILVSAGKFSPGLLKASLTSSGSLFTSISAGLGLQSSTILTANGAVVTYRLGATEISTTGSITSFAKISKDGAVSISGVLSLTTRSMVLTGLKRNNIILFIQGGDIATMNLFVKAPEWIPFTCSSTDLPDVTQHNGTTPRDLPDLYIPDITEGGYFQGSPPIVPWNQVELSLERAGPTPDFGEEGCRLPTLFIKGKGTSFNHSTTLFMPTVGIVDDPKYLMNLFIQGDLGESHLHNSCKLFIANNWELIQTSVIAPGFRNSGFPLFLKLSEANTNATMNLFIGQPGNPTQDLTLFLQAAPASVSGVPSLYVSGQGGPNNNIDLFMRGPPDSFNNNIDLSINGY
jgi:hypothetical protein